MGNTPTCVGKTGTAEHEVPVDEETPPRAGGRRFHSTVGTSQIGNTPTCVGKTFGCSKGKTSFWKHPHVRGEDANRMWFFAGRAETPPRAWGRLCLFLYVSSLLRNTPTCVGKTFLDTKTLPWSEKHPHVRGEDECARLYGKVVMETPPRAWGRQCTMNQQAKELQKHPHVRGEDPAASVSAVAPRETPPRAWGRHDISLRTHQN